MGVTVGAGVFMATGKASEEAGPATGTRLRGMKGGPYGQWDEQSTPNGDGGPPKTLKRVDRHVPDVFTFFGVLRNFFFFWGGVHSYFYSFCVICMIF